MDEKQSVCYLCMVELYYEGDKLCANYAHNCTDPFEERRALKLVQGFLNQRNEEIHNEVMELLKED